MLRDSRLCLKRELFFIPCRNRIHTLRQDSNHGAKKVAKEPNRVDEKQVENRCSLYVDSEMLQGAVAKLFPHCPNNSNGSDWYALVPLDSTSDPESDLKVIGTIGNSFRIRLWKFHRVSRIQLSVYDSVERNQTCPCLATR